MLNKEQRWEYDANLIFNDLVINKITITDHYQKKHQSINNELICEIVNKLDNQDLEPEPKEKGTRNVYVWERIPYRNKHYRLIFWLKDNTTNHLWIRNCYRVD